MKYFPLVWAGLWRKKLRTLFTLVSIAVAFLLFGLLQGVNAWMSGLGTDANANRLYVVSRISQLQPLPRGSLQTIAATAGVRQAVAVGFLSGVYQEKTNAIVALATDVKDYFDLYPEWNTAPDQLDAMSHTRTGAIVAVPLMRQYGWHIGDRLPLRTGILKHDGSADWAFDIVGIYDVPSSPAQANRILINYDYFDEARLLDRGTAVAFVLKIDDPRHSAAIGAAIDASFLNSTYPTTTQDEKAFVQAQLRQLGDVSLVAHAIIGAVLFTLLFLTANTMMQSVRERIPELAMLKTVGFSDGLVTLLVLTESALLCVLAAGFGLTLAALAFPLAGAIGLTSAALPVNVLMMGLAMAVGLALASGLPPAWRAQRLVIVDALAGR